MKKHFHIFLILFIFLWAVSCNKETEFLDAKPNISLVVPTTLDDYQKLLYREDLFNAFATPSMGVVTTDEYYVTSAFYAGRPINERNLYTFKSGDIYETSVNFSEWVSPYFQVYYANTVLDGIATLKISAAQQTQYNQIRGQALFFRAYAFYNLVQTFAMPFDSTTYTTSLGIPLRLSSDFNSKVQRSTIKQSYDQILADLNEAINILPASTTYPTQPSKAAGNALLARVYLAIRNYSKALDFANATLAIKSSLIDYNSLTPTTTFLSTNYLAEDLYQATELNYGIFGFKGSTMVDSVLYSLYDDPNDLRKSILYYLNSGRVEFRGTYSKGTPDKYCGLALDEIYLIRAECFARQGNTVSAMNDLNTLLRTRWKKNGTISTYVNQTAPSAQAALNIILKERRKELPFRGLRWTDIRRLNLEPGYQTTLTRIMNGITYTLPPGDPRFAMSIPPDEIQLSGIQQNNR